MDGVHCWGWNNKNDNERKRWKKGKEHRKRPKEDMKEVMAGRWEGKVGRKEDSREGTHLRRKEQKE